MEDETSPGLGAVDPTTIHEPAADPAPALAYSDALEIPDLVPRSHFPSLVFVAAVLALAAAMASWFLTQSTPGPRHSGAPASTRPEVAAPSPAQVPAAAPTPMAAVPNAEAEQPPAPAPTSAASDTVFFQQLGLRGIVITDPAGAITSAHKVCEALSQGHTDADLISEALRQNAPITVASGEDFIGAASAAYCPQYSSRLGHY